MKSKILNALVVLGCLVLAVSAARFQDRVFSVGAGGELLVSTDRGDVYIEIGEGSEVEVQTRGVREEDVSVTQSGQRITVRFSGRGRGWDDPEFVINIPRQFNVDVQTGSGDVSVTGDLTGQLKIRTNGGDIKFRDVNGRVDVETYGGDIDGGNITDRANISTYGGDIALGAVDGALDISTHGGDIEVRDVGQSMNAKSLGGDIEVRNVEGDIELSTLGGDLTMGYVAGTAKLKTAGGDVVMDGADGDVTVNTSGGDIELRGLKGAVEARTAGGDMFIQLVGEVSASTLASKGGDITLEIPAQANATIEAQVNVRGWGSRNRDDFDISSDFEEVDSVVDRSANKVKKTFQANGGGALISLETTNGNIDIRRGRSRKR